METVDCCGLNCPEPVLRTKAFLDTSPEKSFRVVVDNESSRENVLRFGKSQGCKTDVSAAEDGKFVITVTPGKEHNSSEEFDQSDYQCDLVQEKKLVYVLSADTMGRGSDELGWALLQTYVATLGDVSPLPSHILIYNGGVKLVTTEGKALEALQKLEKQGVTIWVCGTCLEFFKLEKERKVGSITNMFDIMSTMAAADSIVSPY